MGSVSIKVSMSPGAAQMLRRASALVRRLPQRTLSHAANPLNEFRQAQINAVESMPVFATPQLQDTTIRFIQKGDFAVAGELLNAGLALPDFDRKIGSYFVVELLEEETSTERLERAVDVVESLHSVRGLDEFTLSLVLEKVYQLAADEQMDRLLRFVPTVMPWTAHLVESLILRVYLPSLRSDAVISLLRAAQREKLVISAGLWRTIFEVILQPPNIDGNLQENAALRITDRDFGGLKRFMEDVKAAGVKLEGNAIEALTEIVGTTMVPADFIAYLESHI